MAITTPVTLSPVFNVLVYCSTNSSKFSMPSLWIFSSLIVFLTSFMMLAGVEAPAVKPTTRHPHSPSQGSSSAFSIWKTREQYKRQISVRCFVLALWGSPTTTIASTLAARRAASDWRVCVALHIVSNIFRFVHCFFRIFKESSHTFRRKVVWETMVRPFTPAAAGLSAHLAASSGPENTSRLPHQPPIPRTSGWSGSPIITGCRPSHSASSTMRCIWVILGQAASTTRAPCSSSSR